MQLRQFSFPIVLCAFCIAACTPLGEIVDRRLNLIADKTDPKLGESPPTSEEMRLHRQLFIADMHADTLLWSRNFLTPDDRGHVDLPRLRAGNVALQTFAVVTATPNEDTDKKCIPAPGLNMTSLLSFVQSRPVPTWFSLKKHALYQAQLLRDRIREQPQSLRLLLSAADLREVMRARRLNPLDAPIGAILAIEGAHWLGDDALSADDVTREIDELFQAGFRMIALTHRFDNGLSGASEGCDAGGLTDRGASVLRQLQAHDIIVDLAHLSSKGIAEAGPHITGPLVVSHTGIQRTFGSKRNLSDEDVRAVARADGVIGIGYWPQAIGNATPTYSEAIGDAFVGALSVLREPRFVSEMNRSRRNSGARRFDPYEHLAFGSDFDGAVFVPFDTAELSRVTAQLMRRGFPKEKLELIAGLNVCRVLATKLPGGSATLSNQICTGD